MGKELKPTSSLSVISTYKAASPVRKVASLIYKTRAPCLQDSRPYSRCLTSYLWKHYFYLRREGKPCEKQISRRSDRFKNF